MSKFTTVDPVKAQEILQVSEVIAVHKTGHSTITYAFHPNLGRLVMVEDCLGDSHYVVID